MRKILLYSSALVLGFSGAAEAACIQTPSCSSLGYSSSSSCSGGVKCPFGNAWNCTGPNNTTEINKIKNEITNIKKKITELEEGCCSGSDSGSGKCQIGSIFYSDKTCSSSLETGKIPIGVVVYLDSTGHGQAVSLKTVESPFFSTSFYQNSGTSEGSCFINTSQDVSLSEMYKGSLDKAIQDFDSCGNTKKLLAAGYAMQGARRTNEFSTEGTKAGDWCMPAAGVLNNIIENKTIINTAMKLVGGTEIEEAISSTMGSDSQYWLLSYSKIYSRSEYGTSWGETVDQYYCPLYDTIRPVITF